MLLPGTLLPQIRSTTARALQRGALRPVPTHGTTLHEQGIDYAVRVLDNVARKAAASASQPKDAGSRPVNPFLPYDPELFVADVSDTHVALLNKFNVVPDHLLIVTRQFASQDQWLTASDFAAWLMCLEQFDSLGFYNGGPLAGASQPHRHMQLVPLPLAPAGPPFPLWPRFEAARPQHGGSWQAALPFRHALAAWADADESDSKLSHCSKLSDDNTLSHRAARLERIYRELLAHVGVGSADDAGPGAYNLLLTRQWLCAVPRTAECFRGISLNALAFAGGFFVRDEQQLERLRSAGPGQALHAVTH